MGNLMGELKIDYGDCLSNQPRLSEFYGRDGIDLLARLIYSEARGEGYIGKQGVCWVVKNRMAANIPEFGGDTFSGVILSGAFEGMYEYAARCPNTNEHGWTSSLYIAQNHATQPNPIGTCLWFNTNAYYNKNSRINAGIEQYNGFTIGWQEVVEKVIIGNHTFFRVAGY